MSNLPDPKDWHDLESDAIGELQFAMHHYGQRTKADVQMQRAVITKAVNLLIDADVILKSMEAIRSNVEADVAEGKYDNWQPKPKPPLGVIRG